MPFMDGFEVFRRLSAKEETREIPVIFISAGAEANERVQGWKIGAVDFVSKPFDKQELIARVAARLELSRLRKRLEELVVERTASLETANRKLREELAERIRAEQAQRESEARFRNMADTATAVIWTSGGRMNGASSVTRVGSPSQGRDGSAPKGPSFATGANSVAGFPSCPRRVLKT